LYAQLGVDERASLPEIKSAYRELAMRLHPDKLLAVQSSLGEEEQRAAHEQLVAANTAWEVLSDPVRRRAYDVELRLVQVLRTALGPEGHWCKVYTFIHPPTGPRRWQKLGMPRP
jgi:curved DNA-binding protein CbpA